MQKCIPYFWNSQVDKKKKAFSPKHQTNEKRQVCVCCVMLRNEMRAKSVMPLFFSAALAVLVWHSVYHYLRLKPFTAIRMLYLYNMGQRKCIYSTWKKWKSKIHKNGHMSGDREQLRILLDHLLILKKKEFLCSVMHFPGTRLLQSKSESNNSYPHNRALYTTYIQAYRKKSVKVFVRGKIR